MAWIHFFVLQSYSDSEAWTLPWLKLLFLIIKYDNSDRYRYKLALPARLFNISARINREAWNMKNTPLLWLSVFSGRDFNGHVLRYESGILMRGNFWAESINFRLCHRAWISWFLFVNLGNGEKVFFFEFEDFLSWVLFWIISS